MVNLTDGARDTVGGVKSFIQEKGYEFPVYYDTSYGGATAYSIRAVPTTAFINSDGTLYEVRSGAMTETMLRGYISNMLS